MKKHRVATRFLAVLLITTPLIGISKPSQVKRFGKNAPFEIADLPDSQMKSALQALTPARQKRSLQRLHRLSFTQKDLTYLKLDSTGDAFYTDTFLPKKTAATAAAQAITPTPQAISAIDAFKLHSKPGASNIVYLDFDGHVISGTAWNSSGVATYNAKPYDTNNAPNSFDTTELSAIQEIWHRIAEDYAPFNVDITTELPSSFGKTVGRLLITHSVDSNGTLMPSNTGGGVAYTDVWGSNNYAIYYSPALVYYNNLGPGYPPYIAEAASHEMGHNLGLNHDGTSTQGYYAGHGSGFISWGPIMGTGYSRSVSQWSKGEYADANNTQQDDIGLISNLLTYRIDDHSNTQTGATTLVLSSTGTITATNPEMDPFNTAPYNKGIIEKSDDIDFFTFTAGTGDLQINVKPAWNAFTRSDRGANLDIQATLYDQVGQIVQVDPVDNTEALISANITAGTYYLAITGVGNNISPYTDYGSLGEYFISGTLTSGVPTDTTPPNPSTMTWSAVPTATGGYSIAMTATVATDNSGNPVQYQFICVSGGQSCINSAWQTSNQYTVSGLAANTTYTYQVKAKDSSENTTELSAPASTTTLAVDTQPPTPSPMKWLALPNARQSSSSITMKAVLAKDNSNLAVQYQFLCLSGGAGCVNSPWQLSNEYTASGLSPATKYSFKVKAKDATGNETVLSSLGSATTKQALPLAPTNLTGSRITAKKVNLTWNAISNATRYEVWGCQITSSVCNDRRIALVNVNSYTGITPAYPMRYHVKAINTTGSSGFSNSTIL